jgi:hypothetical protein
MRFVPNGAWARVGLSGEYAVVHCAIMLTLWRSLTPLIEQRLNSDEALIALMAKHLAEGRAFPLYLYSLPHIIGVSAWLTAPFFLAGGATVTMLKMPLLLQNVAIAWLLVATLQRDGGLRPGFALIAALPFVLAPPSLSHLHYMDAAGVHAEPLLFIVLLWFLRDRALLFGSVLAFGMLDRAFVGYAAAALLVVQWRQGSLLRRDIWKFWAIAAIGALAVFDLFSSLRVWASPSGPGTSFDPTLPGVAATTLAFACFDAGTIPRGIWDFASNVLPFMLGATEADARLPYIAGAVIVLAAGRMFWISRMAGKSVAGRDDYLVYLLVAGVLSAFVYVAARCGTVNEGTMRYALVTPFAFVGGLGLLFRTEPSRHVRHVLAAIVCAWGLWQFAHYTQILARSVLDPPFNSRLALASYLEAQGVRYASADYWDAQVVTFLTKERVIVASENVWRIWSYQHEVRLHAAEALTIRHWPCQTSGHEAVPGIFWVCSPTEPQ